MFGRSSLEAGAGVLIEGTSGIQPERRGAGRAMKIVVVVVIVVTVFFRGVSERTGPVAV